MTIDNSKPPVPYNREAEAALIGAVLINPAIYAELEVEAEDFYLVPNRYIWQAFGALHAAQQPVDFVTLTAELDKRGWLADSGGPAYLAELINVAPSYLHAEHYAQIVRDKALRRAAIEAASRLVKAAYDDAADLPAELRRNVDLLTTRARGRGSVLPMSRVVELVIDYVETRAKHPEVTWGIPTGFIDLDRLTGGLAGLWYLVGGPGVGKSLLMLQIGLNAARHGYHTAIFSLEMAALALGLRAVSAAAALPTRRLRAGLPNDDWAAFYAACESLAGLPLYICDQSGLTTAQLAAHLARLRAQGQLDLAAIDYLYLMGDPSNNDIERTEAISRRIKELQRTYDIPLLTINSVTKGAFEANGAKNAHLRGSGQLIHDADVVLFISKHERFANVRTLTLTKGRDLEGEGVIELVKMDDWPAFRDATTRPQPESMFAKPIPF